MCTSVYPIVHLVYGSIVIYNNIYMSVRGDLNFNKSKICRECRISIISCSIKWKYYHSTYGREEIRTLLHFIKMKFTSIESPLYNYVYNWYIQLKFLTDARRFELQQTCGFAESDESPINIHILRLYIYIKGYGREEIRTPGSKKNS